VCLNLPLLAQHMHPQLLSELGIILPPMNDVQVQPYWETLDLQYGQLTRRDVGSRRPTGSQPNTKAAGDGGELRLFGASLPRGG